MPIESGGFAWLGSNLQWEILKLVTDKAIRRVSRGAPVKNWAERLNKYLSGEFLILKDNCLVPNVYHQGAYSITSELREKAEVHRELLERKQRPNDPHAILAREPNWNANPVNLFVGSLDFAAVEALRDSGERPPLLSSSAVIVCAERRSLLLHRRAAESSTFPDMLHTLGGAYIPPGTGTVDADRQGLVSTVFREVHEESQVGLASDYLPELMISRELRTGFIQLVCLGYKITGKTLDSIVGNWEGALEIIPFDSLPTTLNRSDWVPSGKGHILAWLALGAPNAGWRPRFDAKSPKALFESMVPRL